MRSFAVNQFGFRRTVIDAFTDGDCWRLAKYLRKQTGWDMVALGMSSEADYPAEERYWEHMAVRMPDGRIVDALGVHTEAEFLDIWAKNSPGAGLFEANDPAYLIGMERQYRHPAKMYGDEILAAINAI